MPGAMSTSANSAPNGSFLTRVMAREAMAAHNRRVPTPASDDAFAEVKAKVDLVKVVQEHVRLTKRNKDFWGLCPFHQEDSPSFKVNPQMQSWYCFGCERSGDVFTFVELIEKTDKRGALQMLAERAGVELKKLSPQQKEFSDSRGQPLAFTARTVRADEPKKYINSPETPAYVKGRVIFGLDLARDEIARRGHAVLMEGQFDVITAHQFGLQNAVASSGTALTEDQVRLLKRFTDELLLVFDSDRAGREAAHKAVRLAAFHDMRTRVATIPDAKDPDEFLRAAGDEAAKRWEDLAAGAAPGFESGMEARVVGLNLSNANHLEIAAARIRELILEFPEPLWEPYRERAERWLGVPFQLRGARPGEGPVRPPAPKTPSGNGLTTRVAGKKVTVARYLVQ